MKSATFLLKQTIYKDEKKLFVLEILLVYISFEGKVQKLDEETKELILSLF
jgi:acyl-CoA thioester hydrolase